MNAKEFEYEMFIPMSAFHPYGATETDLLL